MNSGVRDPLKLTSEALLRPSGVNGVFGRTGLFERIVDCQNAGEIVSSANHSKLVPVTRSPAHSIPGPARYTGYAHG